MSNVVTTSAPGHHNDSQIQGMSGPHNRMPSGNSNHMNPLAGPGQMPPHMGPSSGPMPPGMMPQMPPNTMAGNSYPPMGGNYGPRMPMHPGMPMPGPYGPQGMPMGPNGPMMPMRPDGSMMPMRPDGPMGPEGHMMRMPNQMGHPMDGPMGMNPGMMRPGMPMHPGMRMPMGPQGMMRQPHPIQMEMQHIHQQLNHLYNQPQNPQLQQQVSFLSTNNLTLYFVKKIRDGFVHN